MAGTYLLTFRNSAFPLQTDYRNTILELGGDILPEGILIRPFLSHILFQLASDANASTLFAKMQADNRVQAKHDLAIFTYLQDERRFGWYRMWLPESKM